MAELRACVEYYTSEFARNGKVWTTHTTLWHSEDTADSYECIYGLIEAHTTCSFAHLALTLTVDTDRFVGVIFSAHYFVCWKMCVGADSIVTKNGSWRYGGGMGTEETHEDVEWWYLTSARTMCTEKWNEISKRRSPDEKETSAHTPAR